MRRKRVSKPRTAAIRAQLKGLEADGEASGWGRPRCWHHEDGQYGRSGRESKGQDSNGTQPVLVKPGEPKPVPERLSVCPPLRRIDREGFAEYLSEVPRYATPGGFTRLLSAFPAAACER